MQLLERIASCRYDGTLQPNKTPVENYYYFVIIIIIIMCQDLLLTYKIVFGLINIDSGKFFTL